jgi:hypothetical protein
MSLNQFVISLDFYEGYHDAPDRGQFSNDIGVRLAFWNQNSQGPN